MKASEPRDLTRDNPIKELLETREASVAAEAANAGSPGNDPIKDAPKPKRTARRRQRPKQERIHIGDTLDYADTTDCWAWCKCGGSRFAVEPGIDQIAVAPVRPHRRARLRARRRIDLIEVFDRRHASAVGVTIPGKEDAGDEEEEPGHAPSAGWRNRRAIKTVEN
jgi:hypothetical protein